MQYCHHTFGWIQCYRAASIIIIDGRTARRYTPAILSYYGTASSYIFDDGRCSSACGRPPSVGVVRSHRRGPEHQLPRDPARYENEMHPADACMWEDSPGLPGCRGRLGVHVGSIDRPGLIIKSNPASSVIPAIITRPWRKRKSCVLRMVQWYCTVC
ncbi:hypothetical protein CALCODRAFT_232715 [Calocera cornea HHB12733]|uniref:Uncharacterized protein n=1 Tax=Calocera cornea HHB12733 TaxID=1353952 RepID=A0A165H0Z0_9BASI|nr:hypothetical protein CALCODRAFT_232715 [Calocera cornea HHB12733]